MTISRENRVRMERAHVAAWPASETAIIDGWLWRCSGGGSQRANSVSTITFSGGDPDAALMRVEARYRQRGSVARFQTFDETSPPDLVGRLRARGYRESEATVTMFKRPGRIVAPSNIPCEVRGDAWPAWREVYLGAITKNRRAANSEILQRVPRPRAFFGARRDERLAATALCVVAQGCAVIECVATRPEARRQGLARAVLLAAEDWAAGQAADMIGLQVVANNVAAVALYRQLGFEPGATNRFWTAG